MLARTTTLFALLEEYPFLADFLVARHPAFGRLARPGGGRGWARMATLGEVATAMDLPWRELLRELRAEVQRVTGAAPAIAEQADGGAADPRLQDALREALRDLEGGASLDDLAARLDRETQGLDAEQVAALARGAGLNVTRAGSLTVTGRQPGEVPATHLALDPGHPVRALLDEASRVRELTFHVDELLDGLQGSRDADRRSQALPALEGLLARLAELQRQARRLRLAWYAKVSSRGGHAVVALVDESLSAAVDGVRQALVAVEKGVGEQAAVAVRSATSMVLRALAEQEDLLVPVALSLLEDDDWEAVAEQERAVGWALARDQAL